MTKDENLRWALGALDLVRNGLKSSGHKETDDPTTCSTELWNLRTAVASIKKARRRAGKR